jgi:hypothetical protein
MHDGSGNLLSTASTKFSVPMGNYPVVLSLPSNLLAASMTDYEGPISLSPSFSPTMYSYSTSSGNGPPYSLTLATVDPNATITVTDNGSPVSPSSPGVYTFNQPSTFETVPVTIVVTAPDGTAPATYTIELTYFIS